MNALSKRKLPLTTIPYPAIQELLSNLLKRYFTTPTPNYCWVDDITYIETATDFVYAASILYLFSLIITY